MYTVAHPYIPTPQITRLSQHIHIQYEFRPNRIPVYVAKAVAPYQLLKGHQYTIQGVSGYSRPHQKDVSLRVTIVVNAQPFIVDGKNLLP